MKHIQTFEELNEGFLQNIVMAGLITLNVLGAKEASAASNKLKSGFEMVINNKGKGYSLLSGKEVKTKIQSAIPEHSQGETIKGQYTPDEWFIDNQKYICIVVDAKSVDEAKSAANQKFRLVSKDEGFIVAGFYVVTLQNGTFLIFGQIKNT